MKLKFLLLSLLSGLLLAFSFPNVLQKELSVYTAFFIWGAYIPVIYILFKARKVGTVFRYTFLAGLIFYLFSVYWLSYVEPLQFFAFPAWIIVCTLVSLYIAASFALSKYLFLKSGISYLFSLPVFYTIFEFVREWFLSGVSLLTPAQSQFKFIFLLQLLKFTGVYGVAFLIIMFNLVIAYLVFRQPIELKKRANISALSLSTLLLVLTCAANFNHQGTRQVEVGYLQPNIDLTRINKPGIRESLLQIYAEQIQEMKSTHPKLIVWPEAGFPSLLESDPALVKKVTNWTEDIETYHIIQSDQVIKSESGIQAFNTAYLISPRGDIISHYQKNHLVPFGEYIPFSQLFKNLAPLVGQHGFVSATPGKEIEPLAIEDFTFGALICYDGLFPEISREFISKGASFLVQLSYERWYGNSPASAQIFTNTLLRAVENNVYLVRSVEGGFSGIVTPRGKLLKTTPLFTEGMASHTLLLPQPGKLTFYTRFGDLFIYLLLVLLTLELVLGRIPNLNRRIHGF